MQTCKECGFEQTVFGICERCGCFNETQFSMFIDNQKPHNTINWEPNPNPKRIQIKEIPSPYETQNVISLSRWKQQAFEEQCKEYEKKRTQFFK